MYCDALKPCEMNPLTVREKEMAQLLSISHQSLRRFRRMRIVPYVQVGHVILYDPRKVLKALEKHAQK
jgi:hypothetical protein